MKKKIVILGITGSIGKSAVQVIKNHRDKFKVVLASAHNKYHELQKVAEELNIPQIAVTNKAFKSRINTGRPIYFGSQELKKALQHLEYDVLLNAVVGSAGLKYTCLA